VPTLWWATLMYAIKCTPNKYRPNIWFLLRDLDDFVVHIWTRESEAKKMLAMMNDDTLELTQDVPPSALARATEKKSKKENLEEQ
jgi:hypothetical protein